LADRARIERAALAGNERRKSNRIEPFGQCAALAYEIVDDQVSCASCYDSLEERLIGEPMESVRACMADRVRLDNRGADRKAESPAELSC
jgi:hypothetical protein